MTHILVDAIYDVSIVSGVVMNIDRESEAQKGMAILTLRNMRNDETGELDILIDFDAKYVDRMKTQVGSFITATAERNFDLELAVYGAEIDHAIRVHGHSYRYSGMMSFTFGDRLTERYLIIGTVMSASTRERDDGEIITNYKVGFREKGKSTALILREFGKKERPEVIGHKGIFACGKTGGQRIGGYDSYWIKAVNFE